MKYIIFLFVLMSTFSFSESEHYDKIFKLTEQYEGEGYYMGVSLSSEGYRVAVSEDEIMIQDLLHGYIYKEENFVTLTGDETKESIDFDNFEIYKNSIVFYRKIMGEINFNSIKELFRTNKKILINLKNNKNNIEKTMIINTENFENIEDDITLSRTF